jgi:hypothetical protein
MEYVDAGKWLHLREGMENIDLSPEARQFMEWVLAPRETRSPTPFSKIAPAKNQ